MTTSATVPNTGTQSAANPLKGLLAHGQSPWMDYIRRDLLTGGGLKKYIDNDGLRGMTSNPTIFEKAINGSTLYSDILNSPEAKSLNAKQLFEKIAIRDVQDACDIFRPVYDESKHRDGYVSLEVSPFLANNTNGTLDEARRLWKEVNRPNVMIKVPATPEAVPAIRALLGEGINVNVTLLFAKEAYEGVAHAFVDAIEVRVNKGLPVDSVASVASFFVSRIDSAVDALLEEKMKTATGPDKARMLRLLGKVAIANAKVAYQSYKKTFSGPRWEPLAKKNAQTQRVLWASTGTKNPSYRDTVYVEELIGPLTVSPAPPDTFSAFRDHGKLRPSLEEDVTSAMDVLDDLEKSGISLKKVTDDLLADGLAKFVDPFTKLLKAGERRCRDAHKAPNNEQTYSLPPALDAEVKATLKSWDPDGGTRRLWAGDPSLWTGTDE